MSVEKLTLKWKRPETIDYPKVWHRFQARDSKSDKLVDYRIEDLVETKAEDAFKHMRDFYFKDEPVSAALGESDVGIFKLNACFEYNFTKKNLGGCDDWNLFEDYKFGWDAAMAQRTPIVCYREGSDEIVGVNWTLVNTKEDTLFAEMAANVSLKLV